MGELITAVGLGIGATITPCILPLYPAFLAYMTGSGGTVTAGGAMTVTRRLPPIAAAALVWGGVVSGMVAIGALLALLSTSFNSVNRYVVPAADEPVLLETMAIWCTNCKAQQRNVVDAHALAAFHSISLDVDPNEYPNDLATYADREGFDWRFATANADLVSQLRDRFGTAVAVPPGMPKILFRTDGSVEFIGLGELLSPEQIAAAVSS